MSEFASAYLWFVVITVTGLAVSVVVILPLAQFGEWLAKQVHRILP